MTDAKQLELTPRDKARPWSVSEITVLREQAHHGARHVAALLGRTVPSVKHVAHRLGISLRRPGERRGLLLGQPRGTTWKGATDAIPAERLERMRRDALTGDLDLGEMYRRIREDVANPTRPLCPICTARPQEKAATGLCSVCHYRELARVHRDHEALTEAKRELWRARQARSREGRARRAGAGEPDALPLDGVE